MIVAKAILFVLMSLGIIGYGSYMWYELSTLKEEVRTMKSDWYDKLLNNR